MESTDYKAKCEEYEKVCKDCGESKPLSEYPFVSSRNVYIPRCFICHRKKANQYSNSRGAEVKDKRKEYAKAYYRKDVETQKEYRKQHYLSCNREEQLDRRKKWYNENKERHADNRSKYELANKDRLRAARRKWENNRLATDINYRLHETLAGRIRHELKGVAKRSSRTEELIGCTIEELKVFIENQLQDGMTWDNWETNGWHIDHRIPISWFNLENENCRKLAFSYKNMQPLWGADNLRKKNFYADKLAS